MFLKQSKNGIIKELKSSILYNIIMLQKGVKKMVFDKYFLKRDNILKRRIEIDASLYEKLKELSENNELP